MKIYNYEEAEVKNEINNFIKNDYVFEEFFDFELSDGVIQLIVSEKKAENKEKKYVPSYHFHIYANNMKVGEIDIRIGYTEGLYYGGHIGFNIDSAHRGNGYAGRACSLVFEVAKQHQMKHIYISNEYKNQASIRVCEKIKAKHLRTVILPPHNEMRLKDDIYAVNIWVKTIND